MAKLAKNHFHLVFSFVMDAMMVFIMTCVITAINVGFPDDFVARWLHAFSMAYCVAVPVIYFLAPIARKVTARLVEV
jgi:hypothetical protein